MRFTTIFAALAVARASASPVETRQWPPTDGRAKLDLYSESMCRSAIRTDYSITADGCMQLDDAPSSIKYNPESPVEWGLDLFGDYRCTMMIGGMLSAMCSSNAMPGTQKIKSVKMHYMTPF
ncbi:adp-ribosylation factor family protein [Apiospora arundinis]